MTPKLIVEQDCRCGEGPLWHPDEGRLYWVDIPAGRLFRYEPESGDFETLLEGDPIGGFTLQADGSLLLFGQDGAVSIWRDGELTPVLRAIDTERGNRFNDVIADPQGRVFCGTMCTPNHPGRLYRLDPDGAYELLLEDIKCTNGLGFTPDGKWLYYTDSGRREIYRFAYDEETGSLSGQEVWATVPEDEGVPDGMTVDAEGYVWSARWDGHCVVRYTPDGEAERRIELPVRKVSSLTFGGPDNTDIYVTTAGGHQRATDGELAGSLFQLNLGIAGVPEFRSRVAL